MGIPTTSSELENGPVWWKSMRFKIILIGFWGGANMFIQRSNLGIAIVCMVNHTAVDLLTSSTTPATASSAISDDDNNITNYLNVSDRSGSDITDIEDGEFVWTKYIQGLLLGAVFWGYVIFQIGASYIIEKFGLRRSCGVLYLAMTTCTLLSHPAALLSPWALFVVRILLGVTHAVCMPGMFFILSTWAPPEEKSKMSSMIFAGNMFGNVLVFPISGILCTYGFAGGWPSIFYLSGICSFIWCISWFIWVYDSPSEHLFIHPKEREYLMSSLNSTQRNKMENVPWCHILTSPPVYAVVLAHTSLCWGLYFMLSNLPLYMREILKFNSTSTGMFTMLLTCILQNGIFNMLPYLCMWLTMLVSGVILDKITQKFGVLISRKLSAFLGLFIPAGLLVAVSFLDSDNAALAISIFCLTTSFLSLVFTGVLVNSFDIAPRFSGQILVFSNTIANSTGIITPYLVAALTPERTREQWQVVFLISAGLMVFSVLVFFVFGRVTEQDWAKKQISIKKDSNRENHVG